ncbi:MAG: thioredoxin family protein [Cephaloticoccus sp.]|nr:thioredoxin family protein [Cephaloticoccus sp.]MCF7759833.1 thioredoxin family protein [Cephaloticoccus sp.]
MKMPRAFAFLVLGLTALLPLNAPAQVKASLVAADTSIQPGRPFTVALRLQHDPHWHTYWINPGTGLVTNIAWNLPAGFTAGPIQWPAPVTLKDRTGNVIGNGYEGDQLLPVVITPPAELDPSRPITLQATVDWLMCKDVCMPGEAELQLQLPVSSNPPVGNETFGARIAQVVAGLPVASADWRVTASRTAQNIILAVTPQGPGNQLPGQLHFFADDNLVAYERPQLVQPDGKGGYILTLEVSPDGPQEATQLVGVLTAENGWGPTGGLRGLRIDVPFATATVAGTTSPGASTFVGTLLLAFVGGLILNLMPCVFPVLGIKILGFVNQAGSDRRKVALHGLVFTIGVLVSFWTLAGVLGVLRASGDELGWGFQLQSPAFVFALSILLLVFALNMSGVFEFGLSAVGVGSGLQMKSGFAGSFFTGVLATVVATPCSAPFLAPALGAALALPLIESFTIFTFIAIGLSTPYLLLSIFPGAIKILPRPGAWMETFKQFMAFPLYATVGYLVWVLAGQVNEGRMLMVLLGLVLIAMGVWVYGRWNAPGASAGRARFGLIAGLIVFALGAWTGWPQAPSPTEVTWEKWSPETVAKLRGENRTIYVDFTARWCATCQANKKLVFHDAEILRYFRAHNIATLRGDWTNQDPLITAELAHYNRSAVPFNVIWKPGQTEPVILPELLTAGIVLDALK